MNDIPYLGEFGYVQPELIPFRAKEGVNWLLIALILGALILVLGFGVYYWSKRKDEKLANWQLSEKEDLPKFTF